MLLADQGLPAVLPSLQEDQQQRRVMVQPPRLPGGAGAAGARQVREAASHSRAHARVLQALCCLVTRPASGSAAMPSMHFSMAAIAYKYTTYHALVPAQVHRRVVRQRDSAVEHAGSVAAPGVPHDAAVPLAAEEAGEAGGGAQPGGGAPAGTGQEVGGCSMPEAWVVA